MRLWVVPCHYDPIVHDCVGSIRTHFPDDEILLVDSDSDDPSYVDNLYVDHVEHGNRHYATGAWERALSYGADDFALVHDSVIVHDRWEPDEFQPLRWFATHGMSGEMTGFVNHHARRMFGTVPVDWWGIFGPVLWCSRRVLEAFADLGFFEARPTSKEQASGMERLAGMTAQHLGYDLTNALQGQMHDFYGAYDESFVAKRHRDRQ